MQIHRLFVALACAAVAVPAAAQVELKFGHVLRLKMVISCLTSALGING